MTSATQQWGAPQRLPLVQGVEWEATQVLHLRVIQWKTLQRSQICRPRWTGCQQLGAFRVLRGHTQQPQRGSLGRDGTKHTVLLQPVAPPGEVPSPERSRDLTARDTGRSCRKLTATEDLLGTQGSAVQETVNCCQLPQYQTHDAGCLLQWRSGTR
mmetsp:Transcript_5129/g.12703  ORF Transcript_5129/g.12703 Transcript_5129/m.12703 type:complete len:156 (+) Transcript_5129:468-935(+)